MLVDERRGADSREVPTYRGWASIRQWIAPATFLALVNSAMMMGTYTVLPTVLPFATTNVMRGHKVCNPHCAKYCEGLVYAECKSQEDACAWTDAKSKGAFRCGENRGERVMLWATTLTQWAMALGGLATMALPTMRIYWFPVAWLVPMILIFAAGVVGDGRFEFEGAAPLLVCSVFILVLVANYWQIMIWRYIAHRFKTHHKNVTTFVAVVMEITGLLGGVVAELIIQLGVLVD